jgi:hypothetical protein
MSSKATKPRSKKRVKTYRAALKAAAGAHRCSQGFESIGFDGEHRLVNKVWMKKCESTRLSSETTDLFAVESENQRHVKILTDKARSIIKSAIDEGKYKDREDELEPPFMKPSEHPLNYSWVRFIRFLAFMSCAHLCKVVLLLQGFWKHPRPLRWV